MNLHEWLAPAPDPQSKPIALGTMNFGKRISAQDAAKIIAHAKDRGVTLLDTANAYNRGESERIVGAAIKKFPGAFVIASKVGMGNVSGKEEGLSRAAILRACEESRSRVGADSIDLYYLHRPDPEVPLEESVAAMGELVSAGHIGAWGFSNYGAWEALEMIHIAARIGMPAPVIGQQLYNLLIRQLDVEYIKFAQRHRLHTTVYNALAGGFLAKRYVPDEIPKGSRFDVVKRYRGRYWTDAFFARTSALRALAEEWKLSLATLSYAWLFSRKGIDSVLVGPTSIADLDVALDARTMTLAPECLAQIEALHTQFLGTDVVYAR